MMRMKSYAELEVFSGPEIAVYKRAVKLVELVHPKIDDEFVRCHELARAVCARLKKEAIEPVTRELTRKMNVMDGYYGMVEHSFILLGELYEGGFGPLPHILDVYVPGRVPQVQLIDPNSHLPFYYRRGAPRTDIREAALARIEADWVDLWSRAANPL